MSAPTRRMPDRVERDALRRRTPGAPHVRRIRKLEFVLTVDGHDYPMTVDDTLWLLSSCAESVQTLMPMIWEYAEEDVWDKVERRKKLGTWVER